MAIYQMIRQLNGGGGSAVINPLSVSVNGTYSAPEGVDGYNPVEVTVPMPSGTYSISSNGTYDVTSYASAEVNVSGGGGDHTGEDGIVTRTISQYSNNRVSSIGSYAFYTCPALQTADFQNVETIGSSAFYGCFSLSAVSFPNATYIYNWAFGWCSSLATADFPNVETISDTAFCSCVGLTTASFPNATSTGNSTFAFCSKLVSIYFPKITSVGSSTFNGCSKLTEINFSLAEYVGANAFNNCYSLSMVSFPKASYIGGSAFNACSKLSSVYLLGPSVANLTGTTAFYNTPISKSTYLGVFGSIYVPSSLYDTYIVASRWSTYAARFVSV